MASGDSTREVLDHDEEEQIPMKCRKCRSILLKHPEVRVEDVHGEASLTHNDDDSTEASKKTCSSDVWYIPEEGIPPWMKISFEKGDWVKGKLNCPSCDARVGSYNFVSGFKCPCGSRVVPPIHIVKSKVDFKAVFHTHRHIIITPPQASLENIEQDISS